ncbi:MAG: Hsp70 family protein [Candidatus Poribacteria bacterium]|nr:Hsp70 family protein [Candidatus Poribacteria bacterium]
MEYYVGIDLGTTNSAICTYDKETQQTRVWKSPEQNDVTPSAIYIDRQANEYVGQRALNAAQRSPDNCATLFKRLMGTSTPIELSAVNRTLTPEECSAKVLKTLLGYLPEEIRYSPYTGTVITVPAAFDLGQKNATIAAAEMAGIDKVELVQEPVAALMSYMKVRGGTDGIFLIYNLGDSTLDIAIAESIREQVAILAHGGIQMCGGRDFDRAIVDNIVRPWLHENFALPDDLSVNPKYKHALRLATWATELAKTELSAKDKATISLSEVEMCTNDLKGDEIYLEIPLHRHTYDKLIEDQINETIDAAWETLSKTGYAPNDVQCIVWLGKVTQYKPLRDKVSFELGIKGNTLDVNPITACAEGASIFAESIDWGTESWSKQETIEKDIFYRREQIFESHPDIDILNNPFFILKATQQIDKQRIIEQAEEQSLFLDQEKCRNVQNMLIFPRKRISAEIAWLPGVPPERIYDILVLLTSSAGNCLGSRMPTSITPADSLAAVLSRMPYADTYNIADEVLDLLKISEDSFIEGHPIEIDNFVEVSKFLGFDKLSPIARANLIAARMLRLPEYLSDVVPEWILALAQTYDKINPSEVRKILNVERQESGFPEITGLSDIESAILNIRHYYKQVIKFVLESIYFPKERVQAVMMVVESVNDNDSSNLPILIEYAIDSYEDGAEMFLEKEEKKIEEYDKKLRIAAEYEEDELTFSRMVDDLNDTVKDWGIIAQPIQENKRRQGLRYTASHDVSERVRILAIVLANEYDKLNSSQQILKTLKEVFADFPEITERITADLETLNKITQQREDNSQISLLDN